MDSSCWEYLSHKWRNIVIGVSKWENQSTELGKNTNKGKVMLRSLLLKWWFLSIEWAILI